MTDPISECLEGRLTPELAIARLLLAGDDPCAIMKRIRAVRTSGRAGAALHDLGSDEPSLARLRRMIEAARITHVDLTTPEDIAAMFDRAVAVSPEASVAFYTLGDPARLRAVTNEVVEWLIGNGLLGADHNVLDLGCGIGRMATSIAPHVRSVLGIDTSEGMLREARTRCGDLINVSFAKTSGRDLGALPDAGFDLILAVDSFPYLVQSRVAERHIEDAGRVLRPTGALVILNLAYDEAGGVAVARDWAERFNFELEAPGVSPFSIWDGLPFVFRRPARR